MNQKRKHVLSFLTVLFFGWMAISSASVLPFMVYFDASQQELVDDSIADFSKYLLKNDGTKIYGKYIKWEDDYRDKDEIFIDEKAYPISEILAFRLSPEKFYWKDGSNFYKKIIDGKISIYYAMVNQSYTTATTTTSTPLSNGRTLERTSGGQTRTYSVPIYYYKWQDDKNMVRLDSHEKLKEIVKDCPKAFEKVNMKSKKLSKLMRQNNNYLNEVITLYNNCN